MTTTTYNEQEEQTTEVYLSMSPMKDWPSESDAPISSNKNEDMQAAAEPEQINEGDSVANDKESTTTAATSNKDNNSQDQQ